MVQQWFIFKKTLTKHLPMLEICIYNLSINSKQLLLCSNNILLNNYMNDSFGFENETFTELLNSRSQTQQ